MNLAARALCLDDFEALARRYLPRPIFGYIAGAAERNQSMRANVDAFQQWGFVPRVLRDVSTRDARTPLFGQQWAQPFGIAPMGITALSAYRGDLVLARAAGQAGIPMIVSGSSLIRLEEVISTNPDAWFQAYMPGDRDDGDRLIERVAAAGYRALVVTVDTPVAGNRENNLRNGFSTPLRPTPRLAWDGLTHPRWLFGTFVRTLMTHGVPHFENNFSTRGAPILSARVQRDFSDRGRLDWDQLADIRRAWRGTLVVKGVLSPDDARRCEAQGVDGIIVSNHGGRQLDGAIAPLHALPAIVAACPSLTVMIDGGVRRGTDVLKALALGARFVFVGRPFNFAAAVRGEAGVAHAAALLASEIARNLAMLGVIRITDVRSEVELVRVN